jgi:ABC-type phosphate transport system substrate-binding protein
VFRGAIREWSGLSGATGACSSPISRVVSRKDGTGTTDQFKNYLSRMNGSVLACAGKTWQELRPLVPPSGEPNTLWPEGCTGNPLSPVVRPSSNGDAAIVDTVNANEGAIGYAATPYAESHFVEGTTVIVPLQNNGQGEAAVFATPAAAGQANCGSMTYNVPIEGRRRPGSSGLNVDWTGVAGAQPGIGGGAYPLCMLTYALAFHGYGSAGFVWGKFLTTYDYLRQYLVAGAGQEALETVGKYYAPLPTSGQSWKDVLGAGQYAAGKISW